MCCRTAHYLSLVVAENPVEAHREWRRKQVGTWGRAVNALKRSAEPVSANKKRH